MERIGLLAGAGKLPVECTLAAKKHVYEVYAIALLPNADKELKEVAPHYEEISIGQLDTLIKYLQANDLKKVTMIGKVTKELLFSGEIEADARALQLIMMLPDRNDDTIMMAFIRELAKAGAEAFDQTILIRSLMPSRGRLSAREPSEAERKDMEFGFRMAKELGRLDVGQTVVVKDLAVMALEAIEGTDACIKRGGELARGGAVVVKVAKPAQDDRFDVPTVGLETLKTMIASGCKALAIEASKTLLVEREEFIKLADEKGIAIVAI